MKIITTEQKTQPTLPEKKRSNVEDDKYYSLNKMTMLWCGISAIAVGLAIYSHHQLPHYMPRSPTKPYSNWTDFYPFYLSEHSDPICKQLHFIGTIMSTLLILRKPKCALSLLTALSIGYILCELLSGLKNGFIEFGIMGLIFLLGNLSLTKTTGYEIPILAYAFAWVGHFFFEKNNPASFIYPSYSLMGDYRMTYDIITKFFS